jgi:hypothetical protein
MGRWIRGMGKGVGVTRRDRVSRRRWVVGRMGVGRSKVGMRVQRVVLMLGTMETKVWRRLSHEQ